MENVMKNTQLFFILNIATALMISSLKAAEEFSVTGEEAKTTTAQEKTTTKPKPNFDFLSKPKPEFTEQPASKRRKVKKEKQNLYKINKIMAEKEILQLQEKLYKAKKAAHEKYMETAHEIVNEFVEIGYYEGSCYPSIELDPVLVLNPTLLNTIDI